MNINGKIRGFNILVVEDELDLAKLLHFIFELAEAQVVTVSSATEAKRET